MPSTSSVPHDAAPASAPPARPRPTCTNCKALGHSIEACWETGGGNVGGHDRFYADHLAASARPHANLASDSLVDPSCPTTPHLILDTSLTDPTPDVAQTPVSDNVEESTLLECYSGPLPESASTLPPYLAFLQSTNPFALATFSSRFNTILDLGCTTHIIKDRQYFWTYHPELATPVGTANCGVLETLTRGEVRFRISFQGQERVVRMRECLHAPSVPINLLSVGAMAEKSVNVLFEKGATTIHFPCSSVDVDGISLSAAVAHRLSFLRCNFLLPPSSGVASAPSDVLAFPAVSNPSPTHFFPHTPVDSDLWHRRFGHLGMDATRDVLMKPYAKGISFDGTFQRSHCIPCIIGKHPQQPYDNFGHRVSKMCELLHMDTCGPFPVCFPLGSSMFFIVLDDYSNFGHTQLLAKKSDAFMVYLAVSTHWECKSGNLVMKLRSDGAKELVDGPFGDHITAKGIEHQVSVPYAHPQNGKAERYVRTMEDTAQTLLADSGLPLEFYGDAVLAAQYLRN